MSARDERLAEWQHRLDEARAIGRARSLRLQGGLDFSSNDYLGLAGEFARRDPLSISGSSGSRSLSGHWPAHEELEERLADWHRGSRHEVAALVFGSGYAANEGLLSTILEAGDLVCSDRWNHGSLIDGMRLSKAERLVFQHQDLAHLESSIRERLEAVRSRGGRVYVVTESLFGMDGDRSDLSALVDLCDRVDAMLIVDEAHATGCFGERGEGLIGELGLRDRVFASVHTCGKALGSHGAYVVGPKVLRDWLIQSCRHFIFSTALPAALAQRTREAVDRCDASPDARERLRQKGRLLREGIASIGLAMPEGVADHIIPIVLGSDRAVEDASMRLEGGGLRVPAIRFPTVAVGQARLRVSVRADHQDDELERLITGLRACLQN
ncbi:MAG: aminotransferase class I/II-fold pyridoxal phosphate-dependent enzyme [Planctomycetota bacterium]